MHLGACVPHTSYPPAESSRCVRMCGDTTGERATAVMKPLHHLIGVVVREAKGHLAAGSQSPMNHACTQGGWSFGTPTSAILYSRNCVDVEGRIFENHTSQTLRLS